MLCGEVNIKILRGNLFGESTHGSAVGEEGMLAGGMLVNPSDVMPLIVAEIVSRRGTWNRISIAIEFAIEVQSCGAIVAAEPEPDAVIGVKIHGKHDRSVVVLCGMAIKPEVYGEVRAAERKSIVEL